MGSALWWLCPRGHRHRPHAVAIPRPATLASAQRVPARPVRGTERTARLGSRLYVVSGCGAQRPRRTTPTTATPTTNEQRPRRTTPATNNAHDEQRSRRTTLAADNAHAHLYSRLSAKVAVPRRTPAARCFPRHDCQLLLLRPSVCQLGPLGTSSAPPASALHLTSVGRSHCGPARARVARRGHGAHRLPRLSTRRCGGCAPPRAQVPTTCPCHISRRDSCGGPACVGSAHQGHRAHHPSRLSPSHVTISSRSCDVSTSHVTIASCCCCGPACVGSAHQGHRVHRPPRFSTQQGCGGCVTDDTDRALLLVSPHDRQLLLLRPGVCRLGPSGTQSAPPTSRFSTQPGCGGCVVEDADRALLPVRSRDCRPLSLWLGVCRLGPSGTQSAPPTSVLDSAGLRRLRHG